MIIKICSFKTSSREHKTILKATNIECTKSARFISTSALSIFSNLCMAIYLSVKIAIVAQKSPFSTLLIVHEFKNKFHGEIQIIRSQKPQGDFIQQINHKKEIT